MDRAGQARGVRGVWYNRRSDRFTAEIYIAGVRTILGSYRTIEEASEAYQHAAANRPPIEREARAGRGAFAAAYAAFVEEHGERPQPGAVLEYDGQEFRLERTEFRKLRGRSLPFHVWSAACLSCGGPYEVLAAAGSPTGITRRCEEHRRYRGPKLNVARDDGVLSDLRDAYELIHGKPDRRALMAFVAEQRPDLWPTARDAAVALTRLAAGV